MKKFVWITLGCVLAVSGVYSGLWYFSAQNLKKQITEFFSEKNPTCFMKYETMSCKGFPLRMEVVIKNPTIRSQSSGFEVFTEGDWTIGQPLIKTQGWIEISGKTMMNAQTPQSGLYILKGILRLEIPHLNILKKDITLLEMVFSSFSSLRAENLSFTCTSDGQPLMNVDYLRFNTEKPSSSDFRCFDFEMRGFEIHSQSLINLAKKINPAHPTSFGIEWLENSGKNDCVIQGRFSQSYLAENRTHLCCQFDNMIWANKEVKSVLSGKFEMTGIIPEADTYAISFKTTSEQTSQSHDLFVARCKALAQELKDLGFLALYPKWENLLINHWDQVVALIPKNQGLTQAELDLEVHRKGDLTKKDQDWSCQLRKGWIKSPDFELFVKGHKSFKDVSEASYLEIQIPHYRELFCDLGAYYNRWQSLLTKTQMVSETELPSIGPKDVNRLIQFFESLAQSPDPQQLEIVIQGRTFEDLKVGPY